ncbi:hypothetical protein GIB67_004702 [Kingdonia uniflora]|uniref:Thioredoxin n=1 Tax=Kingdonia uniflora TaxID=39325 RepID=A0A7J7P5Q4_9MAGN|nr:hypothetical protein GIB67_004702 [Kingdonia uniflora]
MVVDFTATWCGPCKMMESALMELAAEFADVIFVKVDVDELMVYFLLIAGLNLFLFTWVIYKGIFMVKVVAQEFGVQTMPTFLLIKQGKEVDKVVGANKDELLKKIEKHRVIITAYAE